MGDLGTRLGGGKSAESTSPAPEEKNSQLKILDIFSGNFSLSSLGFQVICARKRLQKAVFNC